MVRAAEDIYEVAAKNLNHSPEFLTMLQRRLRSSLLTERMINTAARNLKSGPSIIKSIFIGDSICEVPDDLLLLSYELNRQRNDCIIGCNCRGIAVLCVQCVLRTDDKVK